MNLSLIFFLDKEAGAFGIQGQVSASYEWLQSLYTHNKYE